MDKGQLSRYVKTVLKEKGFTQRDIEVRSGGEITDGYVADILRGSARNPSALKIKALARGLGVDAHELFDIVCGPLKPGSSQQHTLYASGVIELLEMMQEIAENPELTRILGEAVQLLPEERSIILESLKALNERRQVPQQSRRLPRSKEKA